MFYEGFTNNLFKVIDGGQANGWDSVEVTYDPNKPLHCGVEQIGP